MMKYAPRIIGLFLLIPALIVVTGFSAAKAETKATWLWQSQLISSEPEQILAFAKEHGVTLLYLNFSPARKAAEYQTFIKKATASGIAVHALGGERSWGLEQNRTSLLAWVDRVLAYNAGVSKEERFTGIHLDIEPYLLPEWKTRQSAVIGQWMGNIEAYAAKARKTPGLEIGCDIPFWLDSIALPNDDAASFGKWLIAQHDHATVMAYRDRAVGSNSISALSAQELAFADELGKRIFIAVEAKKSGEGNFVSFAEEGKTYMNAQLAKLSPLLSEHPSFAGMAVHSYEYWKTMKE
ncbi:hypothetical protein ACTID9_26030 [Brevibacillus fluminis]|uniref:hypothetical protein n=1 Tax=Brevibacillus fluminis TaxID=511487 RepID=UPI003F8A03C3